MDIDMGSQIVRRLDVVDTGRRRRWSPERKLQIVQESYAPGATASSVARLHGISAAPPIRLTQGVPGKRAERSWGHHPAGDAP